MKRTTSRIAIAIIVVLALSVMAAALWADDLERMRSCDNCGMDRKMYGYSRALIRFADGSQIGTCSLNCAVVELDRAGSTPVRQLLVADRDTRALIDAPTARWVMGGDRGGVMARRPKWAFADAAAAEAFVKEHGGNMASWEEILRAAKADARRGDE